MEFSSIQVMRIDLKLTCEYELHTLLNAIDGVAKDHGENQGERSGGGATPVHHVSTR